MLPLFICESTIILKSIKRSKERNNRSDPYCYHQLVARAFNFHINIIGTTYRTKCHKQQQSRTDHLSLLAPPPPPPSQSQLDLKNITITIYYHHFARTIKPQHQLLSQLSTAATIIY